MPALSLLKCEEAVAPPAATRSTLPLTWAALPQRRRLLSCSSSKKSDAAARKAMPPPPLPPLSTAPGHHAGRRPLTAEL